jgi:hypothetical protein
MSMLARYKSLIAVAFVSVVIPVFADSPNHERPACSRDVGDSLKVAAGEVRALCAGSYSFKELQIDDGGELQFYGSVSLNAHAFQSTKGAVIHYMSDVAHPEVVNNFALYADDASNVSGVTIKADGIDAPNYEHPASAGSNGRDGSYTRAAQMGGSGAAGKKGQRGSNAANVSLTLPRIAANAEIGVSAIGGNGGSGQDGGRGGKGGDGNHVHPGKDGGYGGAAGDGGDGGDAGVLIFTFVVADDIEVKDPNELLKSLTIRPTYGAGTGGDPGRPGDSGEGGSHGGRGNPKGAAGHIGKPGAGPEKRAQGIDGHFAKVEVIPLKEYVAAQMLREKAASDKGMR